MSLIEQAEMCEDNALWEMSNGRYTNASRLYDKAAMLYRDAGVDEEANRCQHLCESCEADAADVAGSIKYGF